jgi:hypothetical protein
MLKPKLVTHRRPALIWSSLLLALVFGLGAAGHTASAQAARAADYRKQIYLVVSKAGSAERTVCVGDKVDISARVLTVVDVLNDPNAEKQFARLMGVPLQASVTDPGIGTVTPAASTTPVNGDPPGQARFTFSAKAAGTTTVKVEGTLINTQVLGVVLSADTVSGDLTLTVEKCVYRIDATGVWHMEGNITLIAEITNAALAPDGQGNYAGNADVNWFAETKYPPPCRVAHHPPPSRAYVTGNSIGRDLLEVNVTFEATPAMSSTLICPTRSSDMLGDHPITPDTARFWVISTGGSATRHPTLLGASTTDRVVIYTVTRVTGQ